MNFRSMFLVAGFTLFLFVGTEASGQSQSEVVYKRTDSFNLKMMVYSPEKDHIQDNDSPAMVFFYGGGWISQNLEQFKPHALYYSKKGIVCFLVEYRVESLHKTTPFVALEDAKSAMRFIRENAEVFGISPGKLVAVGGSAGGHLAAATAMIKGFNGKDDNKEIDCRPNALVLFNPVLDNGPGGYGYERIGGSYKEFSPLHNIQESAPPMIILHGDKDHLVPMETMRYFCNNLRRIGVDCTLIEFPDAGHGFFNYEYYGNYLKTLDEVDLFLEKYGFIGGKQ